MHGHVGLLTDTNGSVTDEFPVKYVVSFDIRIQHFPPIFRRLTFKI